MANKKQKKSSKKYKKQIKQSWLTLFIPHKSNGYKPYILTHYGLIILVTLVMSLQLGFNFIKTGSVLGQLITITPDALLINTNLEREKSGLAHLKLNDKLSQAAYQKADDMVQNQYWSHVSPQGVEPWTWIEQSGYEYQLAGENLAKNFSSADTTVSAWMDSPAHKENILNPDYKDVGFATIKGEMEGKPVTITVALYGSEKPRVELAGIVNEKLTFKAGPDVKITPVTKIGIGIQSLTPAAVTGLALLFVAATIAITSQFYLSKLPKKQRAIWKKHNGSLKASSLLAVAAFVILLYSGGQL